MKSIKENEEFVMGGHVFIYTINPNSKSLELKKLRGAKEKKVVLPPTVEEVKEYFKSEGYSEDKAITFHKGYSTNDWKDSNNRPVLNWKMKAINVWFKPENKIQDSQTPKMVR